VNKHYQTSYKSCWPIWGDNHYCYDSASVTDGQVKIIYIFKDPCCEVLLKSHPCC